MLLAAILLTSCTLAHPQPQTKPPPPSAPQPSTLFTTNDPLYTAAQSLQHWWPANGHSLDLVGSRHAQLAPGATFAPGRAGNQAFTFDGITGWVDCGKAQPSLPPKTFTFAFWYKNDPQNDNNGWQYLAHCWDNGGIDVFINHEGVGTFGFAVGTGAGHDVDRGKKHQNFYTAHQPDESWHHMVMTFDGTHARIYRDAILETNQEWSLYTPGEIRLTLGVCTDHGTTSKPFKGQMQDILLFSQALSATEVKAIHTAQTQTAIHPIPSSKDLQQLATALHTSNGSLSWYAAMRLTASNTGAVELAATPPTTQNPVTLATWIEALDNPDWPTRQQATHHLLNTSPNHRPTLIAALLRQPSPESQLRLHSILTKTNPGSLSPQTLLQARQREVLLRIHTPQATTLATKIPLPSPLPPPTHTQDHLTRLITDTNRLTAKQSP
jgi:hypothetical protein